MRIWTTEHIFNHGWDTITKSQWQKYPNPHNTSVMATDVLERKIDASGVLHTHRIITNKSELPGPGWVQRIIGTSRHAFAHEYSTVDRKNQVMELKTVNLSFCNFINSVELMSYRPHPEDPNKTVLKQETTVTVYGVPLTSYVESIIINVVSNNSGKGRSAMEWVISKIGEEAKNLSSSLDRLKMEVSNLTHAVEEKLITSAKKSIEDLQKDVLLLHPPMLKAEEPIRRDL